MIDEAAEQARMKRKMLRESEREKRRRGHSVNQYRANPFEDYAEKQSFQSPNYETYNYSPAVIDQEQDVNFQGFQQHLQNQSPLWNYSPQVIQSEEQHPGMADYMRSLSLQQEGPIDYGTQMNMAPPQGQHQQRRSTLSNLFNGVGELDRGMAVPVEYAKREHQRRLLMEQQMEQMQFKKQQELHKRWEESSSPNIMHGEYQPSFKGLNLAGGDQPTGSALIQQEDYKKILLLQMQERKSKLMAQKQEEAVREQREEARVKQELAEMHRQYKIELELKQKNTEAQQNQAQPVLERRPSQEKYQANENSNLTAVQLQEKMNSQQNTAQINKQVLNSSSNSNKFLNQSIQKPPLSAKSNFSNTTKKEIRADHESIKSIEKIVNFQQQTQQLELNLQGLQTAIPNPPQNQQMGNPMQTQVPQQNQNIFQRPYTGQVPPPPQPQLIYLIQPPTPANLYQHPQFQQPLPNQFYQQQNLQYLNHQMQQPLNPLLQAQQNIFAQQQMFQQQQKPQQQSSQQINQLLQPSLNNLNQSGAPGNSLQQNILASASNSQSVQDKALEQILAPQLEQLHQQHAQLVHEYRAEILMLRQRREQIFTELTQTNHVELKQQLNDVKTSIDQIVAAPAEIRTPHDLEFNQIKTNPNLTIQIQPDMKNQDIKQTGQTKYEQPELLPEAQVIEIKVKTAPHPQINLVTTDQIKSSKNHQHIMITDQFRQIQPITKSIEKEIELDDVIDIGQEGHRSNNGQKVSSRHHSAGNKHYDEHTLSSNKHVIVDFSGQNSKRSEKSQQEKPHNSQKRLGNFETGQFQQKDISFSQPLLRKSATLKSSVAKHDVSIQKVENNELLRQSSRQIIFNSQMRQELDYDQEQYIDKDQNSFALQKQRTEIPKKVVGKFRIVKNLARINQQEKQELVSMQLSEDFNQPTRRFDTVVAEVRKIEPVVINGRRIDPVITEGRISPLDLRSRLNNLIQKTDLIRKNLIKPFQLNNQNSLPQIGSSTSDIQVPQIILDVPQLVLKIDDTVEKTFQLPEIRHSEIEVQKVEIEQLASEKLSVQTRLSPKILKEENQQLKAEKSHKKFYKRGSSNSVKNLEVLQKSYTRINMNASIAASKQQLEFERPKLHRSTSSHLTGSVLEKEQADDEVENLKLPEISQDVGSFTSKQYVDSINKNGDPFMMRNILRQKIAESNYLVNQKIF